MVYPFWFGSKCKKPDDPGSNPGSPSGKMSRLARFKARYGRKTRKKFAEIETQQRNLYKCPYCNYVKVKRIAVGIWYCRKCGAKFAGQAYTVKTVLEKELVLEE